MGTWPYVLRGKGQKHGRAELPGVVVFLGSIVLVWTDHRHDVSAVVVQFSQHVLAARTWIGQAK